MKRRNVKKWINRYIKPYTKDLPTTVYYATELYSGEGIAQKVTVCKNQHVIVNGYGVGEGERARRFSNMRKVIKQTGELIQQIKRDHQHVLLRVPIEISGNRTYTRLITD